MTPARRGLRWLAWLALALPAAVPAHAGDMSVAERDRQLLEKTLAGLAPQRPGKVDLYVVGFAGDGNEDVFRNEVAYLDALMSQRFGAAGRVLTLVNHIDSLGDAQRPLATLDNLRLALAGLGRIVDREQDIVLLFLTTHGTEQHELISELLPVFQSTIDPQQLRGALNASGIRNRVVVVSACYSGGFVPALRSDDSLVIAASRQDRTSFGCGVDSNITYFGRAFLLDGLNRSDSFIGAYDIATAEIAQWEREDGQEASMPQIDVGDGIVPRLRAWQAQLQVGPPVAYPYGR
ncbi:C13 family peptidase [Luteimonas aquatica]|uniref:C13 family peptidase n=1 Tax=Luteimonas aquatica TaxID=450364 RepID=UPI001F575254|nr:C13 family peptidase [Luteimonas aquatica]